MTPSTQHTTEHATPSPNNLILRTVAMPSETNPQGDVFGGWIMSQMDIAGGILAGEVAESRIVTVAAESIKFLCPVKVGDIVACYGEVIRIGTTSLTINLEIWAKSLMKPSEAQKPMYKVTEAAFTYVAVDEEGHKRPVRRK